MSMVFTVEAKWDEEAEVWYSRSNIRGLVIETDTLDEFSEVLKDIAPELIRQFHMSESERESDRMPMIVMERPEESVTRRA